MEKAIKSAKSRFHKIDERIEAIGQLEESTSVEAVLCLIKVSRRRLEFQRVSEAATRALDQIKNSQAAISAIAVKLREYINSIEVCEKYYEYEDCGSPGDSYDNPYYGKQLVRYEKVTNYEAINAIINMLPNELKKLVREKSGPLKNDPEVNWESQ